LIIKYFSILYIFNLVKIFNKKNYLCNHNLSHSSSAKNTTLTPVFDAIPFNAYK